VCVDGDLGFFSFFVVKKLDDRSAPHTRVAASAAFLQIAAPATPPLSPLMTGVAV